MEVLIQQKEALERIETSKQRKIDEKVKQKEKMIASEAKYIKK